MIEQLGVRGCTDLTNELDMATCSERPISSGGFGDIYKCKLTSGIEVAVKTIRLYDAESEQNQKHLKVGRSIYSQNSR